MGLRPRHFDRLTMTGRNRRGDARWERASEEHRNAVRGFAATARGLAPEAWSRPRAPGKWSPAQVAEHLVLAYEVIGRELDGGEGARIVVTGWRQRVLRWVVLPHVLFHRSFPLRAVSPRETRPHEASADRAAVLERMCTLADRVEHGLAARRDARLTHPYFGPVPALTALRFCAVHVEHHRRQIAAP